MSPPYTALVLAGSRGGVDPVAQAANVDHKCQAPVAGVAMIFRVLNALRACPAVGPIAVSIEDPDLVRGLAGAEQALADGRVSFLPSAASPAHSVLGAARALSGPVLVTTADHALLTPDMVAHFLAGTETADADITAGLATRQVIAAAYPQSRRTYLKFRDGGYSGCNLFAIPRSEGYRAIEFWTRLESHRKRPLRMAWTIGPVTAAAYFMGALTLDGAMKRLSRRIGCRAAIIDMPMAEAAIDVDTAEDLRLVEEILSARS